MDSSVPLLSLFSNYSEWKMKMIASLKRQDLYEVSIRLGEESFESENYWLNECDASFGTMCMALSPSMCYLKRSVEYPKDLWTTLDRTFGMIDEDHNSTLERIYRTVSILNSRPPLSMMKLFKMKKKQKLLHSQFELKRVLRKFMRSLISHLLILMK